MPTNIIEINAKIIRVKIIVLTCFSEVAKNIDNAIVFLRNLKLIIIFYYDLLSNFILLKISLIQKLSKNILRAFRNQKFNAYLLVIKNITHVIKRGIEVIYDFIDTIIYEYVYIFKLI